MAPACIVPHPLAHCRPPSPLLPQTTRPLPDRAVRGLLLPNHTAWLLATAGPARSHFFCFFFRLFLFFIYLFNFYFFIFYFSFFIIYFSLHVGSLHVSRPPKREAAVWQLMLGSGTRRLTSAPRRPQKAPAKRKPGRADRLKHPNVHRKNRCQSVVDRHLTVVAGKQHDVIASLKYVTGPTPVHVDNAGHAATKTTVKQGCPHGDGSATHWQRSYVGVTVAGAGTVVCSHLPHSTTTRPTARPSPPDEGPPA